MSQIADARDALLAKVLAILGEGPPVARFDEALTHTSYSNESGDADNQRLEFLGDSILGLCVSELLVTQHSTADEGTLTRMRAALVNAEALARFAREVELGPAIALGRGARGAERDRTNVLADAVEAVVAAVYDARGMEGARRLVAAIVAGPLSEEQDAIADKDPKSALQERVQARGEPTPTYRVASTEGPSHLPRFVVEVLVGETVLASGEGPSKRQAERAAAEKALAAARE